MAYLLRKINQRATADPVKFLRECDEFYENQLNESAKRIIEHGSVSPIVFVSGPSGSGKTTTALKLEHLVETHGAETHIVALDNYFRSVDEETYPRTASGELDFESPLCLDMALLEEHFEAIKQGRQIEVPRYLFKEQRQQRNSGRFLQAKEGDIVIFEGIHALNDTFSAIAPDAFKVYISARSNVVDDAGDIVFKGTWMRLCRRILRDNQFRNTSAVETLKMWDNIREGEKKYISPFKDKADLQFDSSLMCEVCVMKGYMQELLKDVPAGIARYEEVQTILPAFERIEAIDPNLVAPESLLREFMGGGIYKY
ncbi:MAG: nucleoside kinase [Oscillospiraceae bacterium]|nr:nucleoside kinase [Oscillospiraceae bacterium]